MHFILKRLTTAFFIRIFSLIAGYSISIFLARSIGAEGYGVYGIIIAVVNIVLVLPLFGMDQYIVRVIGSKTENDKNFKADDESISLFKFSIAYSLTLSLLIILIIWLLFEVFGENLFLDNEFDIAFYIGIFLIPIISCRKIFSSSLRATHQIFYAQSAEEVLQPFLFISLALFIFFVFGFMSIELAISLQVFSYLVSLVYSIFNSKRRVSGLYKKTERFKKQQIKNWLSIGAPMMLLAVVHNLSTYIDRVMIGVFLNPEYVGYYLIAARNAVLLLIIPSICDIVCNSIIAREYAQNNKQQLQQVVAFQTLISGGAGFFAIVFFLCFSDFILSIFGEEFAQAKESLIIIATGYFIFTLFGNAIQILFMTGHQWQASRIVMVSTALNIVLNLYLIPIYGIAGAAIATAICEVLKGAVAAFCVNRYLLINTSFIGVLPTAYRALKNKQFLKAS